MVQVGQPGREVARVRRRVRRGSAAVLQQHIPVVSSVKVGPPRQHLGEFKKMFKHSSRQSKSTDCICIFMQRQTWASVPPEANRSPALEKATVITGP